MSWWAGVSVEMFNPLVHPMEMEENADKLSQRNRRMKFFAQSGR